MEYCCHVWAYAPSCYLELMDKLQKGICSTVGPSLAASLEPLGHRDQALNMIRHLVCGNNENWLLKLNLIYEMLYSGSGSGLLISMLEKLN